jgi:SAM-dependent methyltransferase
MEDVDEDEAAARARRRELVRRGYDAVSEAYRSDDGQAGRAGEDVSRYAGWVAELAGLLPSGARVADLGCGNGIPATRELTDRGLQVIGADFSEVQLRRARHLVPAARLVQADLATLQFSPASLDAVVSFYALIHLPLADQRALFGRIRDWLRPGGLLLATVGAQPWTGTEDFLGAEMFWEHAGTGSYLAWLEEARLVPLWDRFVPEGSTPGHSLVLARACDAESPLE